MDITEKQRSYITFIEDETGIIFSGTTKEDATIYISENKDKVPASGSMNMWALVNGY